MPPVCLKTFPAKTVNMLPTRNSSILAVSSSENFLESECSFTKYVSSCIYTNESTVTISEKLMNFFSICGKVVYIFLSIHKGSHNVLSAIKIAACFVHIHLEITFNWRLISRASTSGYHFWLFLPTGYSKLSKCEPTETRNCPLLKVTIANKDFKKKEKKKRYKFTFQLIKFHCLAEDHP